DYVDAHLNLGVALSDQGQLAEAIECYDRALRIDPSHVRTRWTRGLLRLLQGDFARGWLDYEHRFGAIKKLQRVFDRPRWDGSSVAGKTILLYAEQGLGDTLQFIRYASLVWRRGA